MPTGVLRFGDGVELDRSAYELRRSGRALKLERIPMEILLLLVERRGQLVSRQDIIEKVWGKDVHLDTDASINAAIRKIRQVLKDDPERPLFVQTVTGKGYRFIAQIGTVAEEEGGPTLEHPSPGNGIAGLQKNVVASPERDIGAETEAVLEPAQVQRVKKNRSARLLLALAFCVVVTLIAARFRPVARPPQVKRVRQITHIGTVIKNQSLVVRGSRVYFIDIENGKGQLRYVSLDGETVTSVETPFARTEFFDVFPSGSELLVGEWVHGLALTASGRAIWRLPVPTGAARRVGNLFADDCAWSPDGHTIAYTNEADQSLNLVDGEGGNVRKLASFPGAPFKPRWSSDGKLIRISVYEEKGSGVSLWQLDASGHNAVRMFPSWSNSGSAWAGQWNRDGSYFFFTGFHGGKKNIWALRDKRDFFQRDGKQPVQLTDGPLDFYMPAPGNDGRTIYAVGAQSHGQLMRYNASERQFEPYVDGISAEHVAFSRDGKWMAYMTYPEGGLARSRVDGSERLQLTFPPMRVYNLQWSPDGSQIAFEGTANVGEVHKIYLISANGGSLRLAVPSLTAEQVSPEWLSDGQTLLFGGSVLSGAERALHKLDMTTGTETVLPGTLGMGMGMGRVSPDGRYLAGISVPNQSLLLYDMVAGTTRRLAELGEYPSWSPDGKYVYYAALSPWFILTLETPEKTGFFRVRVADGSIEHLVPAPAFRVNGSWGFWSGLTPDGSLLVLRDLGTSDIYALDADLP